MKLLLLFSALVLALCISPALADNWPMWRGPGNDGICKETNLPLQWSETKNVLWKLKLVPGPGKTGSTPIIWGDRIFVSSGDGNEVALLCLNTDGKVLWTRKMGKGRLKVNTGETNYAANSPSTDGKHVYAFDGDGNFVCFDFDGNEVWRFNAVSRYAPKFRTNWGLHTTPLLHEDRLYLSMLHYEGQVVAAIDKFTGKEVWKVTRLTDAKDENTNSYTSPIVWQNGKETCLVVLGADYVTGHSLKDGSELWRLLVMPVKGGTDRLVASPVATPDLLVASTLPRGKGLVFGIKPGAKGTIAADGPFVQWQLPKLAPDVSSPLIHDGLVYLARENCFLVCVDAQTGKEVYQQRLPGTKYRASPVYADGRIYLTSHDGYFTIIKPGRKYEMLAENRLRDEFAASPAIANGRIYLRGWQNLYAIVEGAK